MGAPCLAPWAETFGIIVTFKAQIQGVVFHVATKLPHNTAQATSNQWLATPAQLYTIEIKPRSFSSGKRLQ